MTSTPYSGSGRSTPLDHFRDIVSCHIHPSQWYCLPSGLGTHRDHSRHPDHPPAQNDHHHTLERAKVVGAHILNVIASQVHDVMRLKHEKDSEAHRVRSPRPLDRLLASVFLIIFDFLHISDLP